MYLQDKFSLITVKINLAILVVMALIILPKFKLIGSTFGLQGIRIEDFLVFIFLIALLLTERVELPFRYSVISGINLYLIVVSIISTIINDVMIEWIFILRLIEYQVIAWAIYLLKDSVSIIINALKFYIIISFVLAILQINGFVGAFSSTEILHAGHPWLDRAYGLGGGPWDLAVTVGIAGLCLQKFSLNRFLTVIFQILVMSCLLLSGVRAAIVGYMISLIWIYKSRIFFTSSRLYLLILIIFTIAFINNFEELFGSTRLFTLYNIARDIISSNEGLTSTLMNVDTSLSWRLLTWFDIYNLWSKNIFNIFFGIGFAHTYLDGFYARLLFSFGIVGSCFLLNMAKKINIPILIFLAFNALTLDIFISQKIYAFIAIYLIIFNKNLKLNAK